MISFIIPCKNYEKYLVKCLKSVNKQTYKKIEIIVIDDNSSGDCKSIAKKYKANYFRVNFNNASAARHFGTKKAKGNYFVFLDADDYVYPTFCSDLIKLIDNEHGFAYSKFDIKNISDFEIDMTKVHNLKSWDWEEYKRNPYISTTCLIAKKFYNKIEGWDSKLPYWQDFELFLQLGRITKGAFLEKKLFCISIREDNAVVGDFKSLRIYNNIIRKHNDILDPDTEPLITLIGVFMGRKFCIYQWFQALNKLDFDKKKLSLMFIDNSCDYYFGTKLIDYMREHEHEFASVKYIKNINIPNTKDLTVKYRNVGENMRLMTKETNTKYMFIVEDDTLIPSDALKKLYNIISSDYTIGAVEGVEMARGNIRNVCGAAIVRRDRDIERGVNFLGYKSKGIEDIDTGGFFCLLTRKKIAEQMMFNAVEDHVRGPDIVFGYRLTKKMGYKFKIDWSVKCQHVWEENGYVCIV